MSEGGGGAEDLQASKCRRPPVQDVPGTTTSGVVFVLHGAGPLPRRERRQVQGEEVSVCCVLYIWDSKTFS